MPLYAPSASASNESDGGSLTVPWRLVSVGLAVMTVAALAALVTVASINDADELSTVALALAVLAFAAQLVVSLAQGQAATRQEAENRRIASDTQAALAEIRASTAGLMTTVGTQYDRVLDAVLRTLPAAVAEQAEDGVVIDREALRAQVEEELRRSQAQDAAEARLAAMHAQLTMAETNLAARLHDRAAAGIRRGDEVVHAKWGAGRVLDIDLEQGHATIDFPGTGVKNLDLALAPLSLPLVRRPPEDSGSAPP